MFEDVPFTILVILDISAVQFVHLCGHDHCYLYLASRSCDDGIIHCTLQTKCHLPRMIAVCMVNVTDISEENITDIKRIRLLTVSLIISSSGTAEFDVQQYRNVIITSMLFLSLLY